jgi:hypothetical protein
MTKISGGEGEAERDLRREVSGRHEMTGVGLIGQDTYFMLTFLFLCCPNR